MTPPPPKPKSAKKRRNNKTGLSFCQQLVEILDKKVSSSPTAVYDKRTHHNNTRWHLISLPAELRQDILALSIDDEALVHTAKLKRRARSLALVCKTLRGDMRLVRTQWLARHEGLVHARGAAREQFRDYIRDLMAPIRTRAQQVSSWQAMRGPTRVAKRADFTKGNGGLREEIEQVDRRFQIVDDDPVYVERGLGRGSPAKCDSAEPSKPSGKRGQPWGLSRWKLRSAEEAEAQEVWRQQRVRKVAELLVEKRAWMAGGITWKAKRRRRDYATKARRRQRHSMPEA